jgi:hypothetical protein
VLSFRPQHGAVAQLVAHLVRNEGVRGSSPLSSTDVAAGPRPSPDPGWGLCDIWGQSTAANYSSKVHSNQGVGRPHTAETGYKTAKVCPPKHETHKKHETPPVVAPAVVVSPAEAAVNPLPTAAAAGQANTDGQLTAGGAAGLAAFLTLGAGFVLRRRHGEV